MWSLKVLWPHLQAGHEICPFLFQLLPSLGPLFHSHGSRPATVPPVLYDPGAVYCHDEELAPDPFFLLHPGTGDERPGKRLKPLTAIKIFFIHSSFLGFYGRAVQLPLRFQTRRTRGMVANRISGAPDISTTRGTLQYSSDRRWRSRSFHFSVSLLWPHT